MDVARPLNCRFRVDQDDDELVLRRRTGSLAVGLFLVLWLSGWTVGCVSLTRDLIRQPSLHHVLFFLPFWAAWIFASYSLLGSFLGFEQLRIGAHGIEHRSLFARRFVPLDEVMGIALDFKVVTSDRGRNKTTQPVLKIVATGKPLDMGLGVGDEELKWLGSLIREHLQSLIPQRTLEHRLKTSLKSSPRIEVLSPESGVPKPPSTCSIERVDDWDGTTFVRRGHLRFMDLAGITLICMFWNGIIGIFVLQLIEKFQWFLFLFIMPHEVIGLLILAEWLATLCRPFRAERWVIGSSEVEARSSFFGVGRTRRWDPLELGHIELRESAGSPRRFFAIDGRAEESGCSLALVGQMGEDMLRIDALTEGEARWLGGEFCSLLKGRLKGPAIAPQAVESMYDRWLDS